MPSAAAVFRTPPKASIISETVTIPQLMYDYRTYGQDGLCDNVTGVGAAKFVQGDMDDRDRIRETLKSSEFSREQLAEVLGCSPFSVGRLLRKERKLEAGERDAAFSFLGITNKIRMIPVIGEVSAGDWRDAINDPLDWDYTTKGGPHSFALDVAGDSMNKVIKPGLRVVVDPDDRDLVNGAIYVVGERDFGVTLKRFRNDPARLEPDSWNDKHRPIMIGSDEFFIVGRGVQMIGDPILFS